MSAISIQSLRVVRAGKSLIENISLECSSGTWTSVIGPNGAGKTTLVDALVGVVKATSGTIQVQEKDLTTLTDFDRAQLIAYVAQSPVFPRGVSVFDYIALGRTAHQGAWRVTGTRDREVIERVSSRLEIEHLWHREIASLSGGERQRCVIARALAQETPIIALDEPTSELDIRFQLEILRVLRSEVQESGACVLTTLHDLTLAGQFCDRLVVLNEGRIALEGKAAKVIRDPKLSHIYGVPLEVVTINGVDVVVPVS